MTKYFASIAAISSAPFKVPEVPGPRSVMAFDSKPAEITAMACEWLKNFMSAPLGNGCVGASILSPEGRAPFRTHRAPRLPRPLGVTSSAWPLKRIAMSSPTRRISHFVTRKVIRGWAWPSAAALLLRVVQVLAWIRSRSVGRSAGVGR